MPNGQSITAIGEEQTCEIEMKRDIVAEFGGPQQERFIIVTTEEGFRVYQLKDKDHIYKLCYQQTVKPWLVVHLPSSGLVGIVPDSNVTSIKFLNAFKGTPITTLQVSTPILTVKINKSRVIVCLLNSINVYDLNNLGPCSEVITGTNDRGVCALTKGNSESVCLLAFPSKTQSGEVKIFDCLTNSVTVEMKVHDEPVAAMAFSYDGSMLATASESGCEIRVFFTATGLKMQEFMRGFMRSVDISCVNFSNCGRFLCTSSDTETVHIFKLDPPGSSALGKYFDWMSKLVYSTVMMFQDGRAFAKAYLPQFGQKSQVAITEFGDELWLVAITDNGHVYVYPFDPNYGGQLTLHKEFQLKTIK